MTDTPKVMLAVRVDRPQVVALKVLAKRKKVTPSEFVREAIREKVLREAA